MIGKGTRKTKRTAGHTGTIVPLAWFLTVCFSQYLASESVSFHYLLTMAKHTLSKTCHMQVHDLHLISTQRSYSNIQPCIYFPTTAFGSLWQPQESASKNQYPTGISMVNFVQDAISFNRHPCQQPYKSL